MTENVLVKSVKWRQTEISGTFPVVRTFRKTRDDGTGVITIDASSIGHGSSVRLTVHPTQIAIDGAALQNLTEEKIETEVSPEVLSEAIRTTPITPTAPLDGDYNGETEDAAIERINERFAMLDEITESVSNGHVKSVIVSGPPGVGKSFGVEEVLLRASGFELLGRGELNYEFVKGSISPPGLYKKLYEFSDRNCVIVFDDCDDVLLDPVSLSLLKAALDTMGKRILSWNKESHFIEKERCPPRFEFKGGIIFITNLDFLAVKSKLLRPHLEAMLSRCHYLNLDITTMRDKFLRIKGVVKKAGMLDQYAFENNEDDKILEYVKSNVGKFQEAISLRTVLKVADLVKAKGGKDWEKLARFTLLKRGLQ